MPMVPRYDSPTVSPTGLPSVSVPDTAFGSEVAKAVSGLGSQLEKSGDMLARHAIAEQNLINELAARDAENEMALKSTDLMYNPKTGYMTLQREEALQKYQEYQKAMIANRDEIAKRLPNNYTRKLYLQAAQRRIDYNYQLMGRHAATETRKATVQSIESRIGILQNDVAKNWNDDGLFYGHEGQVRTEARRLASESGWDPDTTELYENQAVSTLLTGRIAEAARWDMEKAQEFYKANKDKLTNADRSTVENILERGRYSQGTESAAKRFGVRQRADSSIQQTERTGIPDPSVNSGEVGAYLGSEEKRKYDHDLAIAHEKYRARLGMETMPADAINERLLKLDPVRTPGGNFADRQRVYLDALDRASKIEKARSIDPAFSVSDAPSVQRVYTPDAISGRDQAARDTLVNARMAAQEQAGILPANRSPITSSEAKPYVDLIDKAIPGEKPEVIQAVIADLRARFGENAPGAARQIRKALKMTRQMDILFGAALTQEAPVERAAPDKAGAKATPLEPLGVMPADPFSHDPFNIGVSPPVAPPPVPPPTPKSPSEEVLGTKRKK